MAEEYTLDEMVRMGAQPARQKEVSLAQLRGAGAVDPSAVGDVGVAETYFTHGANALPLGKPIVDIATTALAAPFVGAGAELTPQARAELEAMGEAPPEHGIMDTYRSIRDAGERRAEVGAAQNPIAAGAGPLTAIAASFLADKSKASNLFSKSVQSVAAPFSVDVGSGPAGRIASGALTGMGYGGLVGTTHSKGDLTKGEVGQVARDAVGVDGLRRAFQEARNGNYGKAFLNLVGAGGVGGGVIGLGASAAVEAARRPLAGALERLAIAKGRKVLTNGADQLSKNEPIPDSAVKEAIGSGGIRPGGTTSGAFERLRVLAREQNVKYRQLVEGLEAQGVPGPHAADVADAILARRDALAPNTANEAVLRQYTKQAEIVLGKPQMLGEDGARLGLMQNENLKRSVSNMADYGQTGSTDMNDAFKDIASIYRGATEAAIEKGSQSAAAGSKTRQLADDFVPVKEKLGNLIEARNAARRGNARVAQRQGGSMPGAIETTAAVATGNPWLLGLKAATNAVKTMGPSTVASYSMRLADALRSGRASQSLSRQGLARYLDDGPQFADDLVPVFADDGEERRKSKARSAALKRRR